MCIRDSLGLNSQDHVGHRAANDRGIANRSDQLLQGQVLAHLGLELALRHALRGQHRLITRHRELAIFLQRRNLADHLAQLIVASAKMSLDGFEQQQTLVCLLYTSYSLTRADSSVLGATSMASVLRLFFSESAANSAHRTLALPSGAHVARPSGLGSRGNQPECSIVRCKG